LFPLLLIIIWSSVFANTNKPPDPKLIKKASTYFKEQQYVKAISIYKQLEKQGSWTALRKLGDCYKIIGDLEMAQSYYEQAVEQHDIHHSYYLSYASVLLANEHYTEARKWFEKYHEYETTDERIDHFITACDRALNAHTLSEPFEIITLGINSIYADFGPAFFNDELLFSSAGSPGLAREKDQSSNASFLDIYHVPFSSLNNRENITKLQQINTANYHEGPACWNQEGNKIYYTSNNVLKREEVKSQSGEVKLKIYSAIRIGNAFKDIEDLNFNGNEYSCAHPSVNKDESIIYFSSDVAGGFGGTDIYYCTWDTTFNRWSKPINAGESVNTEMNERFPFITEQNVLYFSSDGHLGYGGLDVYMSPAQFLEGLPVFKSISNVGSPINSSADDFSLITRDGGRSGYFSSNRKGGLGSDDIYGFERR